MIAEKYNRSTYQVYSGLNSDIRNYGKICNYASHVTDFILEHQRNCVELIVKGTLIKTNYKPNNVLHNYIKQNQIKGSSERYGSVKYPDRKKRRAYSS